MNQLTNKFALFILLSVLYVASNTYQYNILFILVTISLSGALDFFDKKEANYILNIIFLILCIFFNDLIFFIPLLLYDCFKSKQEFIVFFYLVIFIFHSNSIGMLSTTLIISATLLSYLLKLRTVQFNELEEVNKIIKDDSEELKILHELKHIELLEKQDYEIQVAKLEERNRIAREIHDSVGHNLSSSLLQIGAIIAINKNNDLDESLNNIKDTLSDGMNSIRSSVHNLHEDNLKLEDEMQMIIRQFNFCKIDFIYKANDLMDIKLKYCFINILKEALNNIMKHSNASYVNISLIESSTFYQFMINDNGTKIKLKDGLGLKSMQERTYSFRGIFNFSTNDGFKIFINIPKEQLK